MAYRVVHCGTGNIGAIALKAIIAHPDLELVGQDVSTPDKAGRDPANSSATTPSASPQPTTGPTCSTSVPTA